MQPRISVITLGVNNLETSLRFYRDGLGLPTDGIIGQEFEYGAVVFIDLQPGLRLALWPRVSIAHDTGLALGAPLPDRADHRPQCGLKNRGGCGHGKRTKCRSERSQTRSRHLLGRIFRLLSGPGRPRMGSGVEPGLGQLTLLRPVQNAGDQSPVAVRN